MRKFGVGSVWRRWLMTRGLVLASATVVPFFIINYCGNKYSYNPERITYVTISMSMTMPRHGKMDGCEWCGWMLDLRVCASVWQKWFAPFVLFAVNICKILVRRLPLTGRPLTKIALIQLYHYSNAGLRFNEPSISNARSPWKIS